MICNGNRHIKAQYFTLDMVSRVTEDPETIDFKNIEFPIGSTVVVNGNVLKVMKPESEFRHCLCCWFNENRIDGSLCLGPNCFGISRTCDQEDVIFRELR